MKILIVEDEEDIREMVTLGLESWLAATVLEAKSAPEAIQLLKENDDIDCVVSDYNMPNGHGGMVYEYLLSVNSGVPFILCSSEKVEDHEEFKKKPISGWLQKPFRLNAIVQLIRRVIPASARTVAGVGMSPYFRIKKRILFKSDFVLGDVFIKLSDEKYVRVIRKGDRLTQEDVERYGQKNLDYLYLRREDSPALLAALAKDVKGLISTGELPYSAVYDVSKSSFETVNEVIQAFGLTAEAQNLAEASVKLALESLQRNPDLAEILARVQSDKDSFLSAHSVVLAHAACLMNTLSKQGPESARFRLILATAAFLHDITLDNEIASAFEIPGRTSALKLEQTHPERAPTIPAMDFGRYLAHPGKAAAIVHHFTEVMPEAQQIILQHHERPDGTGFPEKLKGEHIGPLAARFIVAHDLVVFMASDAQDRSPAKFIEEHGKDYQVGHFKTVLRELESAINR